MKVLFYRKPDSVKKTLFQQMVESRVPDEERDIYENLNVLKWRLHQPITDDIIGVFLISESEELSDILSFHDLFHDIRLILILPDHDDSTVTSGHILHPRFMSYIDTDFSEVAAVLEKMMTRIKTEQKIVNIEI